LLLDPAGGDVVFVARVADNLRQKLYAYKSILIGNSEYFARGNVNLEIALIIHRSKPRMEFPETSIRVLQNFPKWCRRYVLQILSLS
jgi:hypothetical protein